MTFVRVNKSLALFMKTFISILVCFLAGVVSSYAQMGLYGQPHASAALDVKATDKAFYPPRLTSAQRRAIVNPQPGAFVYDLDKGTFYLFDGQNWSPLAFTSANNLAPIDRTASDGAANDRFGYSVAISGDYAIVGAPYNDVGANADQGLAYIFARSGNTWIEQAILTATNGAANDNFGYSVAISGDYAIVGVYQDDVKAVTNQGSAYIFMRTGSNWTVQASLLASNGSANDYFGNSVSISGDYAVVGASNDALGANTHQESVYVFVRSNNTWAQQAILTASDGGVGSSFGHRVAISGDYILIGSPNSTINGKRAQGAAYVFVRGGGTWTQQAKFTNTDYQGATGDNFGISVAISGDYAVVGAHRHSTIDGGRQGSAYVFMRSNSIWTLQTNLTAEYPKPSAYFGFSVSISGNYIIVGAHTTGDDSDQGSDYIFVRNGAAWPRLRTVADNSPADTNNGASVGISNGSFIISGPGFQQRQGKVSFGVVDN